MILLLYLVLNLNCQTLPKVFATFVVGRVFFLAARVSHKQSGIMLSEIIPLVLEKARGSQGEGHFHPTRRTMMGRYHRGI